MYTFKEAIERIKAVGGDATYDQLRHWDRLGVLEVVQGKSRGGRPPKVLTEESLGAAISLSRWYRVVRNPEAAKILLWLEGFEYLGVDPVKIVQKHRNELYEDLKRGIPSLPPFDEIDAESPLMDSVLSEIDENFTRRGLADLGGLIPLIFSMTPNPEGFDLEQKYSGLFEDDLTDPLPSALDMLLAIQNEMLKATPEIRDYLRGSPVDNPDMLRALGVAMVRGNLEEVDWEFIRAFWKIFSVAVDLAYELSVTGQIKGDREATILVNLYLDIYRKEKDWPGGVLMILMPYSLVAPEDHKREYKQMITLLSQARMDLPPEP